MQVEAREMVEVLGLPSDPRQRPLGKEFALLDRYVLVDSLADTMAGTKYRYRVQSLLTCAMRLSRPLPDRIASTSASHS